MHRSFLKHAALATAGRGVSFTPVPSLLFALVTPATARDDLKGIETRMGIYRFTPADVQLAANQPAVLRLIHTDGITPHNFRLNAGGKAGEIDVDVSAGESVEAKLDPIPEGGYTFYCDKKLPFMMSHREKGMEGRLIGSAG